MGRHVFWRSSQSTGHAGGLRAGMQVHVAGRGGGLYLGMSVLHTWGGPPCNLYKVGWRGV